MENIDLWLFDKNRILILFELLNCQSKELGGCDIRDKLKMKKPLLNYHIKILKEKGFISENPVGRDKYYKINEDKIELVRNIIEIIKTTQI